jgi:proline iminopeptidase
MPPLLRLGDRRSPTKLLCLHGGTGLDYSYFLPFVEPLAQQAELIFYRQGDRGALDIAGLVEELDAVVNSLNASDLVLLGHSFGGALALEYLNRIAHPPIRALILVSWVYDKEWFSISRTRHAAWLAELARQASQRALQQAAPPPSAEDRVKQQLTSYVPLFFTPPFHAVGTQILANIHYNPALFETIFNGYLTTFDLIEVVRNLQLPTLSIAGDADGMVDVQYIRQALSQNPRIESHELKDVGHFPFVEQPTEFNQAVLDFLMSTCPSPGGNSDRQS